MKKIFYLHSFLLFCGALLFNTGASAQSCFTVNSPVLSCTVPCATLTVVPGIPTLAATTSYSVASIPYAPYAYTGGTAALGTGQDDIWGPAVNLPFQFCFFTGSYNQCIIGANGQVGFDMTQATLFNNWSMASGLPGGPTPAAVRNAILGPYHDIDPGITGGTLQYKTYGVRPCRQFVVSWNNEPMFSCTTSYATQQIVLYESTNVIDINIGHKIVCAGWNGGLAITGINNAAGTLFYTAPGENGTQFTATNQSWRFTPTGVVSPWVYAWSGPGGPIAGATASIVVCPATTTVYTVTATNAACVNLSVTLTATVTATNSLPPITGTATLCAGSTVVLSDITAGGTWTSSNTNVATIGLNNGVVSGVMAGTTTITYSQSGCNQTYNITVVKPGVLAGATLCIGGTTTLSDSPAGGTWTSSTTGVATIVQASGLVTGVAPGTTTITYHVTPGCTATAVVTVVTLQPITGVTSMCQGKTTTLSNNAGGGTWTSANTTVATIGLTSGIVTGGSPGSSAITYIIAGGCRATTTVTVNPALPITGVTSLCQRRATTILSDALGGVWSGSTPSIATITPAGVVYGVTPGAAPLPGIATFTYTNTFGCVSQITVTVNPTPGQPAAAGGPYCQFVGATQLAPTGTGPTFTWYGMGVTAGYSPGPIPSTLVPGVDTYFVTQTSVFGCTSDSATVTVIINARPPAPQTRDTSYCQFFGSPASIDVQVSGYTGTLNWYQLGAPFTGSHIPSTNPATYPDSLTWYVSQIITTNGLACEGDSAVVSVMIIPKPVVGIAYRDWICQFDSMKLSYTTGPGGGPLVLPTYLWSIPRGAGYVGGTNQTDSTVYVQFDTVSQSNYITLTVSDLNGECTSYDTVKINVIELPTATAYSKADVCLSDTVSLALSSRSASATDFTWYIDNTPLFSSSAAIVISANSNSGGPFSISWTDTGLHVIHVQTTADHGCTSKPTADTVEVHGLPDATFRINTMSGTLCLEDSVHFTANDSNYQNIYKWAPAHFFNNVDKYAIWGRVELEHSVVTLTVTDPFGCIATASREIDPTVCCSVPFPNAFSPNGDGHNDIFRPVPMRAYHRYHVFRIQNRWGQTIFESSNNKAEWDGTFNGVLQDVGVYFYYLKYDCDGKTIEQKGDLTIIR